MPFTFEKKDIHDVILIMPKVFEDERGFFEETFKASVFKQSGIDRRFVQDNHSFSRKGVLRGLHFQSSPEEQGKLVSVISGRILDVAVDIRPSSEYFGKWISEELTSQNHKLLWIPEGFAHGFLALEDSHVLYKTTREFSPDHDNGIIWNDPDINVSWPIQNPIVSKKDQQLRTLKKVMEGLKK